MSAKIPRGGGSRTFFSHKSIPHCDRVIKPFGNRTHTHLLFVCLFVCLCVCFSRPLIVKIYLPEIDGSSISENNPKIISFTNILVLMVDPFTGIGNVEYTSNYLN